MSPCDRSSLRGEANGVVDARRQSRLRLLEVDRFECGDHALLERFACERRTRTRDLRLATVLGDHEVDPEVARYVLLGECEASTEIIEMRPDRTPNRSLVVVV